MAAQADRGVPRSTICPKYLHANSTSHTWPFSAIAELIDNAYDPDVSAKQIWIDKTVVKGQECLSFMDNGNGLDYETMHKMLSFGYSEKTALNGLQPIGVYGNGFKSGSMRLGSDAIVFSKSKSVRCVGMLSQTYLREIHAEQIIVPILCFEQGRGNKFSVREEHMASLQDILHYSPFKTEAELLLEVDAITSSSMGSTGTRIIIWNLRRTSSGASEFDFERDRYDIRIPADVYETLNDSSQHPSFRSYTPESVYSLRAYCSILYLKPRTQIIIRGQKVKTQLISKSLAYIRKDYYKPTFLNRPVLITFGYNTKSKDQYGVMMYHKNRLIKAYERVGCQLKANNKGVGVIGVIECNFLDPIHNKQNFNENDKYRKTMYNLGIKLEEYWQEIQHKRKNEDPNSIPVEDITKRPDQNWAQCDECMKWRKLPDGIDCSKLPEKWYCRLNPDPQFRSCQVDMEPVDSDDEQLPYRKTYKQQERKEKKKRQKDEEDRKRQELQHVADLPTQNQALQQQLHQNPAHSPFTPTTPSSRINTESVNGGAARAECSIVSQAACSPSSGGGLPIISNVCSLSSDPRRGKRTQLATPQTTPKRPRVNSFKRLTSAASTSFDTSPQSSPFVPVVVDNANDDIFILEHVSSPKPQRPDVNLSKIKTEPEQRDIGMLLECNEDAALDASLAKTVAGMDSERSAHVETSPSPAPHNTVNITTQTEVRKVKMENEDLNQAEERALLAATETMPGAVQDVEKGTAQQVESLIQELSKSNKERDELRSQLDHLEEEKAKLASQCEELRLRLQQQRENTEREEGSTTLNRTTDSFVQTDPENTEGTEALSESLIELRRSIGRLLVNYVPALDLGQVNYECNVIDEILDQVVQNMESAPPDGL